MRSVGEVMKGLKKSVTIALMLTASAFAVDKASLLLGVGIGLGVYSYQGTRNHIVNPMIKHVIKPTAHVVRKGTVKMYKGVKGKVTGQ